MADLLLGIDIGTSSCKCSLLNSDGKVLASVAREYHASFPQPGWVEQDPRDWFQAFLVCLAELEERSQIRSAQIGVVGVTGQMRGPTFIGTDGLPVRPSILWNDLRCQQEVAELNSGYAGLLRRVTHNPLNTMCTLPKLLWVMRHEADTWLKTSTLIYPKDYLTYRLTGNLQTDLSDASGSSFYDIHREVWSQEILETFSIDERKLPEIRASNEVIGTVSPEASRISGLAQGTPVVTGASDATIEMFALGIDSPSQCKIRLGRSGALSTVVNQLDEQDEGRYYCWSYIVPGKWMLDLNTRACANSTVWLREIFYKEIPDSTLAYGMIEAEARKIPLGAQDLYFHPYLLGEDAPYWDPSLKASFFGLTSAHQRAHLARAVLEGTGFALRDALSIYGELAAGFEEYIFVGGGVKNALWLAIVADILGIDARIAPGVDAAAGAAMLAGIGTGVFSNLSDAAQNRRKEEKTIRHDAANHEQYNRQFERYLTIKRVFDRIYS